MRLPWGGHQGCCILGNSTYYLDETPYDQEHGPPSPLLALRSWMASVAVYSSTLKGSRLTTIGSWALRTTTQCEGVSGELLISMCGAKGGTYTKSPATASRSYSICSPQRITILPEMMYMMVSSFP